MVKWRLLVPPLLFAGVVGGLVALELYIAQRCVATFAAAVAFGVAIWWRSPAPPSGQPLLTEILADKQLTSDGKLLIERHATSYLKATIAFLTLLLGGSAFAIVAVVRSAAEQTAIAVATSSAERTSAEVERRYTGLEELARKSATAAVEASAKIAQSAKDADAASTSASLSKQAVIKSADEASTATATLNIKLQEIQSLLEQLKQVKSLSDTIASINLLGTKAIQAAIQRAGVDSAVSASIVPPGTVVAWPGDVPEDAAWRTFWRVCNGGSADFNEDLWKVLSGRYGNPVDNVSDRPKTIILPSFQGYFLRGFGGDSNPLGQQQTWSTGKPAMFSIDNDGSHVHQSPTQSASNGTFEVPGPPNKGFDYQGGAPTDAAGIHSHTTSGWDKETRPSNFAVHWVIRVK